MRSRNQINNQVEIDQFASRIVQNLDEALIQIPLHIEQRIAAIREKILLKRFGARKSQHD